MESRQTGSSRAPPRMAAALDGPVRDIVVEGGPAKIVGAAGGPATADPARRRGAAR